MKFPVYAILQGASFAATASGSYPLFRDQAAGWSGLEGMSHLAAMGAAALFSGAIQAVLSIAWMRFCGDPLRRPVALAFGITFSCLSALFAAGAWVAAASINDLSDALTEDSKRAASAPLSDFSRRLADIAGDALVVAEIASRKEEREARTGGSCDNDSAVRPGVGPKALLRRDQKRLFAEISEHLQDRAARASALAVDLARAETDEAMRALFLKARQIEQEPARARTIAALKAQHDGFENGWPTADGLRFVCADGELRTAVSALLVGLETDLALGDAPPSAAQADYADALSAALETAIGLAVSLFGGPLPETDSNVILGVLIAAAIDLAIVFLIGVDSARMRVAGDDPSDVETLGDARRSLGPEALAWRADDLRRLGALTISAPREGTFFAVPLDGAPDLCSAAQRLALRWKLRPDRNFGAGIDLARIEPHWVASRLDWHGGANRFRMFRITTRTEGTIRRVAFDVGVSQPQSE